MYCPKCAHEQDNSNLECDSCGIIFAKYYLALEEKASAAESGPGQAPLDTGTSFKESIRELLFFIPDEINRNAFAGRAVLFVIILLWGIKFMAAPIDGEFSQG